MARFVEIREGVYINTDLILDILEEEKYILLRMVDGTQRTVDSYMLKDITGESVVRSIVPVEGFFYEHLTEDGKEELLPLHFVGVTYDGSIRAVDPGDVFPQFIDGYKDFSSIFKGEEDLVWQRRYD
jgi:hypothetical protein